MEQVKVSRAEALDLLGDLLDIEPKDTTTLFGAHVERKRSVPKPKWQALGLIALFKETKCLHCGTIHRELNPLVLLHEQLVAHDGTIVKDQKTSNPLSANVAMDTLPDGVRTEVYMMAPIHFCYECMDTFKDNFLDLFKAQLKGAIQVEAAEVSSKLKAANEAKQAAESRLLQLAESWENPMSQFDSELGTE